MTTQEHPTAADWYYANRFPAKLYIYGDRTECIVSTSDDQSDTSSVIAEFNDPQKVAFVREMIRRWNHSPKREQALMDIREMAAKRAKIRMPCGMGLDLFCGVALLESPNPNNGK